MESSKQPYEVGRYLSLYKFHWWKNWGPKRFFLKSGPRTPETRIQTQVPVLLASCFLTRKSLVGNTRSITVLEKAQHGKVCTKQVASAFLPDHRNCQQKWKDNSELGAWPRLKKKARMEKKSQIHGPALSRFPPSTFPSSLHTCSCLVLLLLWCRIDLERP